MIILRSRKRRFSFLLPTKLRIELSKEMHDKSIQNLYFFRNKTRDFIAYVSPFFKPIRFCKDDYMNKTGENICEGNIYII
jgi:hypothetical protein